MNMFIYFLILQIGISFSSASSKWDYDLDLQVTRCFKLKDVKIKCDGEYVPEKKVMNAELLITAIDGNDDTFIYGYGKSIEGPLCSEHLGKLNKIIKNVDQICISGDGENLIGKDETFARWVDAETKRGRVER